MSILIKGEKMPKSCGECPCICLNWSDIGCAITASRTNDVDSRLPDCPLVEIPPYSKLIDANMVYQELLPYSNSFRKSVLKVIENIPTVIESEEQEHGRKQEEDR